MNKKHIYIWGLVFLQIIIFGTPALAQKPNVIIILTDDQSFNSIGYTGGDVYTPCIDSLSREGIRFTNFHVPSTVCSPSRYSLLTGKYATRSYGEKFLNRCPEGTLVRMENIVELSEGEAHLGNILQENGYKTGFVGKTHIMDHAMLSSSNWEDYGLQTYLQTADPYDPVVNSKMKQNHDVMQELVKSYGFDYADGIYMANVKELNNDALNVHNLEWTVDKARKFIMQEKDNPFFLYFSTTLHHGPVPWGTKDGEYWSSFHADPKLTGEGMIDTIWDFMPDRLDILNKAVQAGFEENTAYALLLDEGVRAIYKQLVGLGIEDNTLIIFMSDHGSWRHGKATLHDYGSKVPMFMYWKGSIASGGNYPGLVQSPDFAPTILDLAGVTYEGIHDFDGKSLEEILLTGTGSGHESLFCELGYARSVKTEKWKYIANRYPDDVQKQIDQGDTWPSYKEGTIEIPYLTQNSHLGYYASKVNPHYFERNQLYDLEADSAETVNVIEDYPDVVIQMKEMLSGYLKDFENRPFAEFTLEDNSAPMRAILPVPRSTSTNIELGEITLEWTNEGGADSHDVYFGTSNPPPFIGNQVALSFKPELTEGGTTHYWRIDEVNEHGKTTGDTWSFTTESEISTKPEQMNQIKLYPNPAGDLCFLDFQGEIIQGNVRVSVHSLNGTLLQNNEYQCNNNRIAIDTSRLMNGAYILKYHLPDTGEVKQIAFVKNACTISP